MAEVKPMRNGVYVSDKDEAICVVRGDFFKGATLYPCTGGNEWPKMFRRPWDDATAYNWTEDTLVLPEEYLT